MSYEVIDPTELPQFDDRAPDVKSLSDAVNLDILGIRVYTASPGDQLPLYYHYHEEQEEAFYVVSGTLHVETPEDEFTAAAGEFFVAEAGSPHRAFNPDGADSSVEVVAFGAPTDDPGHRYEK